MKIVFPTLHVRKSAQATPLAAACLAAAIHDRPDCNCILLDFFPDDPQDKIVHAILKASPDLIVIPLYTWNRAAMLAVCRELRQQAPTLKLLAGGPEATADPAGVINEGALDAAIRGEGEETFVEVIDLLLESRPLTIIPGLSLPKDGSVIDGPERVLTEPENLVSPWLTGIIAPPPGGGLLWEVARGCRFECSYCFDSLGAKGVSKIHPERLAAELDLFREAGVSQVWVLDSTFNDPPLRGKHLLQIIAAHAPNIHFHLEAKIDFIDDEMIQMMAFIPCSVQIGIQSFHPQVLRAIYRTIDIEHCIANIRAMCEAGITYGFDLIYGLPTDTLNGFRTSLDTAFSLLPNQVDLFPLSVLPGTRLASQTEKFNLRAENAPPYEIIESDSWSSDMLEKARLLTAATDLFYNIGRAVGFFQTVVDATDEKPVPFLEGFADWLMLHQGVYRSVLCNSECWLPEEILPMQEGYVQFLMMRNHNEGMLQAALDLIRYHFHYAETLLEQSIVPVEESGTEDTWHQIWQSSTHIRLVPFAYEILDLQQMDEIDLEEFIELFRPVGSVALFYRRDDEVFCESMEEDFLTLLKNCNGELSPEEIFAGAILRETGEEIVRFAVSEGFLLPAD